jgi:hypothetical protein
MMVGASRCVAVASSIIGFAGALGLCAVQSPAHAQTTASALKVPAVTKLEPTPKALTGTLFNTREQRESLDRARQRGGAPEDEVVAAAEPGRSVINGFVKRSDGRNTAWVDDVMKRDPRSEVVEQLEPNVVGGLTRGLAPFKTPEAQTSLEWANKTGAARSAVAYKSQNQQTRKKRLYRSSAPLGAQSRRAQR